MQKVKKTIKTVLASLLLAGAFAVPASASSSNKVNIDDSFNTDNSKTTTYNLSECSGIINQSQSTESDEGGDGDDDGEGGNSNANASQNVNFAPDCSKVTNVTNVTNESQVKKAPKGAVHAGAGGASSSVSTASILGVLGSIATMGVGLVLRRQGFEL